MRKCYISKDRIYRYEQENLEREGEGVPNLGSA